MVSLPAPTPRAWRCPRGAALALPLALSSKRRSLRAWFRGPDRPASQPASRPEPVGGPEALVAEGLGLQELGAMGCGTSKVAVVTYNLRLGHEGACGGGRLRNLA